MTPETIEVPHDTFLGAVQALNELRSMGGDAERLASKALTCLGCPPENPGVPILPAIIALDETHTWDIPEELQGLIERIETVYMFDWFAHTYCCELRPGFFLEPLGYRAIRSRTAGQEEEEAIDNLLLESELVTSSYFHIADIESYVKHHPDRIRFMPVPDLEGVSHHDLQDGKDLRSWALDQVRDQWDEEIPLELRSIRE